MGLLSGKVALVTGAGRGIGAATARLFAGEGATVVVHYNASAAGAARLAEEIGAEPPLRADLTLPDEARRLVADALARYGRVDVLVNNAASFTHGVRFAADDWSSYAAEWEGVFGATFHVTRALAPHLIAARSGRIVNFGATLLRRPASGYGPHIVAKSAIAGLTAALARELGPYGITVNIVHPGMTLTDATLQLAPEQRERVAAITPLRRLATAEDAARAALLLASDYAGFVTGAGLAPDGGLAVY